MTSIGWARDGRHKAPANRSNFLPTTLRSFPYGTPVASPWRPPVETAPTAWVRGDRENRERSHLSSPFTAGQSLAARGPRGDGDRWGPISARLLVDRRRRDPPRSLLIATGSEVGLIAGRGGPHRAVNGKKSAWFPMPSSLTTSRSDRNNAYKISRAGWPPSVTAPRSRVEAGAKNENSGGAMSALQGEGWRPSILSRIGAGGRRLPSLRLSNARKPRGRGNRKSFSRIYSFFFPANRHFVFSKKIVFIKFSANRNKGRRRMANQVGINLLRARIGAKRPWRARPSMRS